jgi:hypothetical protein
LRRLLSAIITVRQSATWATVAIWPAFRQISYQPTLRT